MKSESMAREAQDHRELTHSNRFGKKRESSSIKVRGENEVGQSFDVSEKDPRRSDPVTLVVYDDSDRPSLETLSTKPIENGTSE